MYKNVETAMKTITAAEAGWLSTIVQLGFVVGTALAAVLNLADLIPSGRYFAMTGVKFNMALRGTAAADFGCNRVVAGPLTSRSMILIVGTAFFGERAPARPGAICLNDMATGTRSSCAFRAGASSGFGMRRSKRWLLSGPRPTRNMPSIPRLCGHTNMQPA